MDRIREAQVNIIQCLLYSIRCLIGLAATVVAVVASLHMPRIVANLFAILQCGKQALRAAAHEVTMLRLHIIVNAHCAGHAQCTGAGLDLAQITWKGEEDQPL